MELQLENRGSLARDHLANERTYLAWLRTSMTFTSIGVAVAQLFRIPSRTYDSGFLHKVSLTLGEVFVSGAILMTIIGVYRYYRVQTMLQKDLFPAPRISIAVSFTLATFLIFSVLSVLIKVALHSE